jgi:hypothetical protein
MTPEELNQIDRELAEWPMGFDWSEDCEYDLEIDQVATPGNWHPTSDPKQAFMVVDAMVKKFRYSFNLSALDNLYEASFCSTSGRFLIEGDTEKFGRDHTPELAICVAAKAVKDSRK